VSAARNIARLMTGERDRLPQGEAITVALIEAQVPKLAEARTMIERFQAMIRERTRTNLEPWIADAGQSLVASFAAGEGSSCCGCGSHRALVEWADRGPDHQAQARQASDVRTREARPS